MRLHALLFICLFCTVTAFAQEVSPCDNLLKTELDSASGVYTRASKQDIVLQKNGKDALTIVVLVMDRTVIVSFTAVGGVYCIDETSKIDLTFADGLEIQMAHNGKFNCDGDFSTFFYGSFGHKKEFAQLVSSPLTKVKVGLRKSVVEKNRENFIEVSIPEDKAKQLMATLNCLVE
jgi:hypothetical protein